MTGPIQESKDMHVIFQKKEQKRAKKGKIGHRCTKFDNTLKKGSFMHATT